jgi:DNA-directed RNA polymerase
MNLVQGRIVLDVSIKEEKLERLLEMIREINEYNVELNELNIPLCNGDSQEVKVDGISVEWLGMYDEDEDGVEIKNDHQDASLNDQKAS